MATELKKSEKNIIIHMGMPKCGSTFLQSKVFPNINNTYFEGNDRKDLNPISTAIRNIIAYKDPLNIDIEKTKREVDVFLNRLPEKNIIISYEALFGCFFNNYRDKKLIADLIYLLFPKAKLLLIIRKQNTWVHSIYKQLLSVGYSFSFKKFTNYCNSNFENYQYRKGINIDVKELNYYNYISYLFQVFNKERVFVLPFEYFLENKKEFLKSVFQYTNLPEYYPSDFKHENKSYSFISAYLAIIFNRFFIRPYNSLGFIPEQPFLKSLLKVKKSNTFTLFLIKISAALNFNNMLKLFDKLFYIKYSFLKPSMSKKIMQTHNESNKKLNKIVGFDLKKYGYFE